VLCQGARPNGFHRIDDPRLIPTLWEPGIRQLLHAEDLASQAIDALPAKMCRTPLLVNEVNPLGRARPIRFSQEHLSDVTVVPWATRSAVARVVPLA
jgi:hypothetical protein